MPTTHDLDLAQRIHGLITLLGDAVWTCDEDTDDDLIAATWTPHG
jgi:hypothetical protein